MLGLLYIGYLTQPVYTFSTHKHDSWEIVYYTKGSGQLIAGNQTFDFEPKDIFCMPPGMNHSEHSKEGFQNIHYIFKGFPGFPKQVIKFKDTVSDDYFIVLQKLYNEYYLKRRNWINITEALLNTLYQYIVSWYREKDNPLIEQIKNLLVSNLSNPHFQLKNIYDQIPLSPDHARKLFKKHTGKNPLQYLNDIRLEHAKSMLEHMYPNGISIKEIASMCGFSDPYYFSRAFRKTTGKSPSQWAQAERK